MDSIELIRRSQGGDEHATDMLMRHILNTQKKKIARYLNRNVLVTDDDVQSEFALGCFRAVARADLQRGDPLAYIVWKGQMAVAQMFRQRLRRGLQSHCRDCGSDRSMQYGRGKMACSECGSHNLAVRMRENCESSLSQDDDYAAIDYLATRRVEHTADLATVQVTIDELRGRLQGRTLELFNLIVSEGIERGTGNYLKEIGERWGCSKATVAHHLRQLRAAVLEYLES